MSQPAPPPRSAREAFGQSFGGRFTPTTSRPSPDQRAGRRRLPVKPIVGVLSAILLVSTAVHIMPAIRAGLRDGTLGRWIATTQVCHRSACLWNGKFVAPGGRVLLAGVQYAGSVPSGVHAGTSIPALFTGGSGIVFPATGSDLWIGLLIALLVSVLGLYWSSYKWVTGYVRERRNSIQVPGL